MRAGVMGAEVLFAQPVERERERAENTSAPRAARWDPDAFAREQIRGLVRQVFFSSGEPRVRQVVLTAVDAEADANGICRKIGEALALETDRSIGVVVDCLREVSEEHSQLASSLDKQSPLRGSGTQLKNNLWQVPSSGEHDRQTSASLHSLLGQLRTEFEYSLVAASPAGESNEAAVMAQFADGIILVLSAHRTRRILARKVKERLDAAKAKILGVVLSDRDFPMPEGIYRRL